jgi:hypothetical protein
MVSPGLCPSLIEDSLQRSQGPISLPRADEKTHPDLAGSPREDQPVRAHVHSGRSPVGDGGGRGRFRRGDKLKYRLDNAWRLDRVLAEAERRGVFVMLCLDYHRIFEIKPDYWGGNNFWPRHPYNATNDEPCQLQNEFFTNAEGASFSSTSP